jgi:hypothetical protein
MTLGFNVGRPGSLSLRERINIYKELGCKAVEISCIDAEDERRWAGINELTSEDLALFDYISLHAPALNFMYANNDATMRVLGTIQNWYERLHFKYAIIHPDRVADWGVFKGYSFPIATENMDSRKEIGRTVESLSDIFAKINIPLVLDMNHCYVNDTSMNLAAEMYSAFKDRIVQIHVSGFRELHDPLYQTRQSEIIKAIPDKNLPIVIESYCPTADDIRAEYKYIHDNI